MRAILVDDHEVVRLGVRAVLEQKTDVVVVGEADNGHAALALAQRERPDLVIMDISMRLMNGVEATRELLHAFPTLRIIALSMHTEKGYIQDILKAGAVGYLTKSSIADELVEAVRAVESGGVYIGREVSPMVFAEYAGQLRAADPVEQRLSSREVQVLQLIAEGKANKEIGALLCISPRTVEMHRRNLMQKVGVDSVAEMTKMAIKLGITPLH